MKLDNKEMKIELEKEVNQKMKLQKEDFKLKVLALNDKISNSNIEVFTLKSNLIHLINYLS